ncbi:hypothetical protein PMAYCL1PPCAC_19879 [Pristionchus mayeri]|uniref:Protein kinase domain-containing protein n=1 Tax=Pristionchus mayeri TaxID=1317129 RepID=A0AAN5CSB9_9BILA|nr:hypothetical protein PMAYCL1PPCAC_19879 [Pristionchus mayeri]
MQKRGNDNNRLLKDAVELCKQRIDDCVERNTPGSSDFIREIMDNEVTRINNFARAARDYLELLGGRVERSQNNQRTVSLITCREHFTDYLTIRLDLHIQSLKESLRSIGINLNNYKRPEREQIRKAYHDDLELYEKFLLFDKDPFWAIPMIDLAEFANTKQPISRGGEGSVYQYEIPGHLLGSEEESLTVAAKKFEISIATSSSETRSEKFGGKDEINALFKLQHPNIVQMIGLGLIENERCLLIEFCPRSLDSIIKEGRAIDKCFECNLFVRWMMEITYGLRYVHAKGYYHGDLKPANILISFSGQPKLADFGLSQVTASRDGIVSSHRVRVATEYGNEYFDEF